MKRGSILSLMLENMVKNVVEGVNQARELGINCEMPDSVTAQIPIDINGLPCGSEKVVACLEIRIKLKPEDSPKPIIPQPKPGR